MVDVINLKYLIVPSEQFQQEKDRLGNKYTPVFESPDRSEIVLQNRTVLPKGWLVPSVSVLGDPRQALAIMQGPMFDPQRLALVETPPPLAMAPLESPSAGSPGQVTLTRFEGERIDLKVTNNANALLVLGEKYYKGWRAKVDGKATDIHRVNYILRGVYLPPGQHEVSFTFEPLPFKVGKYLTFSSMAVFMVMLFREVWLRRKSGSV